MSQIKNLTVMRVIFVDIALLVFKRTFLNVLFDQDEEGFDIFEDRSLVKPQYQYTHEGIIYKTF